jgi:hypothetical protein
MSGRPPVDNGGTVTREGCPVQESKIVAHTRDGRIIKGLTLDFDPAREGFHVLPAEGGGIPVRLTVAELKALFYVRDWLGNRDYRPPSGFGHANPPGRRCVVTFHDGEVIFGFTPDYDAAGVGFSLYPSDPADNNERIFVVAGAVQEVRFP